MRELIIELFFLFSMETGILGMVKENIVFLEKFLLIIGIFSYFAGFKIYRAIFSIIVFIGVVLTSVFLMKDYTDWGTITTIFSVLGTVFGFLVYRAGKLGGFIICGLMGGTIVWINTYSMVFSIVIGLLVASLMLFFPVIILSFITSLWGAFIIKDFGSSLITINKGEVLVFWIMVILGFGVQIITNTKQELFEEPYPPKLKSWLQKKEDPI